MFIIKVKVYVQHCVLATFSAIKSLGK